MVNNIYPAIYIFLLASIQLFRFIQGDCIRDQEDDRDLSKKQQFSIETTWLIFERTSDQLNRTVVVRDHDVDLENSLVKRFNEALGDSSINVVSNVTGRTVSREMDTISLETNFSTDQKPASGGAILSADLLRALDSLVDCNRGYGVTSRETGQYCKFMPSRQLSITNPNTDSSTIVGTVRLKLDAIGKSETGCYELCKQIISSKLDVARFGKELLRQLYWLLETVISALDPHHWLALVVAIWLTTCFFIAMFIKRRDKRRLRLYLEERTDYSFSARR